MSQEKVDKYKQQKKNRKNPKKVSKFKKILPYIVTGIVIVLVVGFFGISIGKQTGLITTPTEYTSWSDAEVQSLRQLAIQQTDPNVQYTTLAEQNTKALNNNKITAKSNTAVKTTTKKSAKK